MKKLALLLLAISATTSAGIGLNPPCDTRICYASYLDCLNQGLPSTLCYNAYITCRDSGCNPV